MRALIHKPSFKPKEAEKGQSLVELAISLIILLILLSGIVDLGRAIVSRFLVQDAAEEGMVYGTSFPTDCNQIVARIRDNVPVGILKSNFTVNVLIQTNPTKDGNYTSCFSIPYASVYAKKEMLIRITFDFPIAMPFLGSMLGSQTIPMTVTTNGSILRPPDPDD